LNNSECLDLVKITNFYKFRLHPTRACWSTACTGPSMHPVWWPCPTPRCWWRPETILSDRQLRENRACRIAWWPFATSVPIRVALWSLWTSARRSIDRFVSMTRTGTRATTRETPICCFYLWKDSFCKFYSQN